MGALVRVPDERQVSVPRCKVDQGLRWGLSVDKECVDVAGSDRGFEELGIVFVRLKQDETLDRHLFTTERAIRLKAGPVPCWERERLAR